VVVRARCFRAAFVERLEVSSQQNNGDGLGGGIRLEGLADLVASLSGHGHIGEHDIWLELAGLGDGLHPVLDGGDREILGREDQSNDLPHGERIIGDQKALGHGAVRMRD
jgi:hypothetical protein